MSHRRLALSAALATVVLGACMHGFSVKNFPASDGLFAASLREYNKKNWDNAVAGFEKLTLDLSARDTLLPLSHWYLAKAHDAKGEHILAATGFARLSESFPDDTLADDALLAAANSYMALWKNPELDPQYGTLAQVQYRQLIGVYPDSPLSKVAEDSLKALDERYAEKDYGTGMYYVRRGGFDSAIIMFKDVVKLYPNTDRARMALLRMVDVYRKPQMNYKEEAAETCKTLRTAYPTDKEVVLACGGASGATAADSAAKTAKPDSTARATKRPR